MQAQLPVLPPIHKSMAAASLLVYLIVSKFADGLPLQNHDPDRDKTYEAKLWVYAKDSRHGLPLIVYAFPQIPESGYAAILISRATVGTCRPMPIGATIRFTLPGRSLKSPATCTRADDSWKQPIY